MSEEEKKAIEELEHIKSISNYWISKEYPNNKLQNYISIALNLIEKLQKENEEYGKQLDLDYVDKNYISKDKIREKIEKLEKEKNMYFGKQIIQGRIDLLKELLEE